MFRFSRLLAIMALAFAATVSAETIVSDSLGNQVGLPTSGGTATGVITNTNSLISTSPYTLYVFVNDGDNQGVDTGEAFFINPPNNAPKYGEATLIESGFSSTFSYTNYVHNTTANQYLGTASAMNNIKGLYLFKFAIPVLQSVFVNLTYKATGPHAITEQVSIFVSNPATVVGDPQFVGLRGQSFQVHGIDGAVYNIISEANTQVNSRFVFLAEGACPIIDGKPETNCWSHPGSYLGQMSFQARDQDTGKVHSSLITAGSAKTGFASITLDGKTLSVGDSFTFGDFAITVVSAYRVSIQTESFSFELSNSDNFINQAVATRKPLSKITAHGLLGQTSRAKVYPTATRYIEGEVDDYAIVDDDIFGSNFAYNLF